MSILVDRATPVMVQGITGKIGTFHTQEMLKYGTNIVCGVTPGKGGSDVHGVPVFDTVKEAVAKTGAEASVMFVPPPFAADSVMEAADGGLKLCVAITDGIPAQDMIRVKRYMRRYRQTKRMRLIGPNCAGIISPGKAAMGWLGGSVDWAKKLFEPGPVGVISRSGGQSGTVPWALKVAGLGISTAMHIGTEPVLGLTMSDVLKLFEEDEQTKAVAIFGEIGGTLEEEAADTVAKGDFTKPLVVFIAGAWAPEGMRFSHASSIVERGRGTAQGKIKALTEAKAYVVDSPEEIAPKIKELIDI